MVIIQRSKAGSYILGELDGSLSKLRYAAFRLIPYQSRLRINIDLDAFQTLSPDKLDDITHDSPHPEEDWPLADLDSTPDTPTNL